MAVVKRGDDKGEILLSSALGVTANAPSLVAVKFVVGHTGGTRRDLGGPVSFF